MLKYILKRIGFAILAMFILLTLLFFLMQLIPGYPIEQGVKETNEEFQKRLALLNLDKDPFTQYLIFWKDLFTEGLFGINYQNIAMPVVKTFMDPVKYTLMIAFPAFIISSILGIVLGIVAAYFRGRWQDTVINVFAVIFTSIPSFVLALYLVQLAGLLNLPTNFIVPGSDGFTIGNMLLSLIIPILSMVLTSTSTTIYFTRNEMVEIMKQEYIRTALAKGMSFRSVIFKHGLRNAAIPVLYSLLPSLLTIISGSIIIEQFFNVPGTAVLIVNSVQTKNIYVIMFSAIFYSGIYFLLQIVFDIISTFIDPRIKLAEASDRSLLKQFKAWLLRKKDSISLNLSLNSNNNPMIISNKIKDAINENNQFKYHISEYDEICDTIPISSFKPHVYAENNIKSYDSSKFDFVDVEKLNLNDNISGKPSKQWKDIFNRFCSNKWAVFFSILFLLIIFLSIFVPIFSNGPNSPISEDLTTLSIYLPPRIPWLGLTGETTAVISEELFNALKSGGAIISSEKLSNGVYYATYNPYLLSSLNDYYPIFGTDQYGRDWWTVLWFSTSKSLLIAIIVAAFSTLIGAVYGAIAGYNAGKPIDTIMMRIVEIISGVPTIVWILVISLVFSDGGFNSFTISVSLILIGWIWPATSTRVFVMKYKDAEYIEASRTLGASNSRLIFKHLLPNISGKLMVRFVNQIPRTIFFETSLVFLGLVLPDSIGLGSMIEVARQTGYFYLLIGPTMVIVLITLSAQIIANAFNDALDPKVTGE